jgi:uncharacterized OsmC-like protein
MATPKEIKQAVERAATVLSARPAAGQNTNAVECVLTEGLRADWSTGSYTFTADMKKTLGGDESAPSPGTYARGSLAACLCIGYALVFARRDIPIGNLKVRVETDLDARGTLGVDDIQAGWNQIRYFVDVDSPADPEIVKKAIEEADRNSPILNSFVKPVPVAYQINVNSIADKAE